MPGLNPIQFKVNIVVPTLMKMGGKFYSLAAVNLLMGTAIVESDLRYIQQVKGPALGVYQMEPRTHNDIWERWLIYRKEEREAVEKVASAYPTKVEQLMGNLFYATAMARVHYYRVPFALPKHDDLVGLGQYWKDHYNTPLGKGKVEDFVQKYSLWAKD